MARFDYIVKVHPVENGKPNLNKVDTERTFDDLDGAEFWINRFNYYSRVLRGGDQKALYHGRINRSTGEAE